MALVYIVEDDSSIREIETIALKNSGHKVYAFENAKQFFKQIEKIIPDLLVLDIMLPDKDGNEIVGQLRRNKETKRLPIIMVTAKAEEIDMIRSLENGADDYIKKPFSIMELITRVKALLRRCEIEAEEIIKLDEIQIDNVRHRCLIDGEVVQLTFKEHELLKYLMINEGIVVNREQIMSAVWGESFEGESRTVDMHIKTLRQKLKQAGSHIRTVRNVGYVIE